MYFKKVKMMVLRFIKTILLFFVWVMSIVVAVRLVEQRPIFQVTYNYLEEVFQLIIVGCWNGLIKLCGGLLHFVSSCAWQLLIVAFFCLLDRKDKLDSFIDAILGFIKKSHWGNDAVQSGVPNTELDGIYNNKNTKLANVKDISVNEMQKGRKFESFVFAKLQDEFRQVIRRDVRIFGSNITFDGVIEEGRQLVGVEIKYIADIGIIKRILSRVDHFYKTLSDEDKKRFSVLVCMPYLQDECKNRLEELKLDFVVPIAYRFFEPHEII